MTINTIEQLRNAIENARRYIRAACCLDELSDRQAQIDEITKGAYRPASRAVCRSKEEMHEIEEALKGLKMEAFIAKLKWQQPPSRTD